MRIVRKFVSVVMMFAILETTSVGADGFPLEGSGHFVVEDTERNMYVIGESALDSLDAEYLYIASVSNYAYGTASLYEKAGGGPGVLVVEDSLAVLLESGNEIVPLAVVLTAVAIDFGLIGVMYSVYATQ